MTLRVEKVSKRFGEIQAVHEASFAVPEGRVCGLLGSNGAGKTTCMRMIMRIFLPDAGEISWHGRPVTDEVRMGFGYLPEERGLYPKMQTRQQLIYLTELKGLPRAEAVRRVDRWIERLGLQEYASMRVEQLSKGNQQKVQFTAAAASGPSLCILDEPFTGLDPINTVVMEEAFRSLSAEGTTILFSSHNMDTVESLCQDVVLMTRSKVVLAGELREIKRASRRQSIRLRTDSNRYDFLERFDFIKAMRGSSGGVEFSLPAGVEARKILLAALSEESVVEYSLGEPSLREIYLEKVGGVGA